jgi:hypothetical protein
MFGYTATNEVWSVNCLSEFVSDLDLQKDQLTLRKILTLLLNFFRIP